MQTNPLGEQQSAGSQANRSRALRCALSWPVAKRSLAVMLLVGSVLNVINQGDVIWSHGAINWWKLFLTYCVPFCVATYGAYCAYCTGDVN